jgi:hypothetical protein
LLARKVLQELLALLDHLMVLLVPLVRLAPKARLVRLAPKVLLV